MQQAARDVTCRAQIASRQDNLDTPTSEQDFSYLAIPAQIAPPQEGAPTHCAARWVENSAPGRSPASIHSELSERIEVKPLLDWSKKLEAVAGMGKGSHVCGRVGDRRVLLNLPTHLHDHLQRYETLRRVHGLPLLSASERFELGVVSNLCFKLREDVEVPEQNKTKRSNKRSSCRLEWVLQRGKGGITFEQLKRRHCSKLQSSGNASVLHTWSFQWQAPHRSQPS